MAQSISQEAIGATGLPGATAASRHAGATASGAPTTGTFAVGDYVVDQTGAMYVCTVAGTPGTWQLSGVSVNENIAGKNFIINGGMDIWQRGTSFSIATGVLTYTADRWCSYPGVSTWTVSQLAPATITAISSTSTTWTFTVANNFQAGQLVIISGCTPTGYNGTWTIATASSTQFTVTNSSNPGTGTVFGTATTVAQGFKNAMRVQRNSGTTSTAGFAFTQSLETQNSLPLAGKTVTLSFWARASSSISSNSLTAYVTYGQGTDQNTIYGFTNQANFNQTFTTTSGWALYTLSNYTLPTNITQVGLYFFYTPAGTAGSADYFDITGVQLEIAPQATPFSRAGGSIGGELALCMRYYERRTAAGANFGIGIPVSLRSSTSAYGAVTYGAPKRVNPTIDFSNIYVQFGNTTNCTPTGMAGVYGAGSAAGWPSAGFDITLSGSGVANAAGWLIDSGGGAGYIAFLAEL